MIMRGLISLLLFFSVDATLSSATRYAVDNLTLSMNKHYEIWLSSPNEARTKTQYLIQRATELAEETGVLLDYILKVFIREGHVEDRDELAWLCAHIMHHMYQRHGTDTPSRNEWRKIAAVVASDFGEGWLAPTDVFKYFCHLVGKICNDEEATRESVGEADAEDFRPQKLERKAQRKNILHPIGAARRMSGLTFGPGESSIVGFEAGVEDNSWKDRRLPKLDEKIPEDYTNLFGLETGPVNEYAPLMRRKPAMFFDNI